jgi:hypothetical protein
VERGGPVSGIWDWTTIGISCVYWIIPQAHRIYRYSTSPGGIPRYHIYFNPRESGS